MVAVNNEFQPIKHGGLQWSVRKSFLNEDLKEILRKPQEFLTNKAVVFKRDVGATVGGAKGLVLKWYHSRKPVTLFKDLFRGSRAHRACRKAYHLELSGIPTPKPVAVASKRTLGILIDSFFVMQEIEGATHLRSWRGNKKRAALDLAELAAKLHQAGFSHRDLKDTNIVFDAREKPHLIDVDGVKYMGRIADERASADLARLAKAALRLAHISRADRARFLIRYCRFRDRPDWKHWWRQIERRLNLVPARSEGQGPRWLRLSGAGVGFMSRHWQEALAGEGLRSLEDFFGFVGEALSKPGLGSRYRARLRIKRAGENHVLFLKRYESESMVSRLKRRYEDGIRNTAAQRDVRVAAALAGQGIATPETLAWGWKNRPGGERKSFVVSRAVAGDAVDRSVSEPWSGSIRETFQRKRELVRELGRLARTFHEGGWCHRDFYLCHIFVEWVEGAPKLSLIDLQRVFRPRWRVWRWRIKDLAQLNFSARPEIFSRSMRLRFAKIYFGQERLTDHQKGILRKVRRKTESISRRNRSLHS
jgi:heptose I phosphotransferase